MATCKDCIHHDLCDAKGNLILTINDICELEYRSDVSEWWCKHYKPTADVAPRAEVAREIFWEMDKLLLSITIDEEAEESFVGFDFDKYIALKKKYTEAEPPEGD